MDVLSLLELPFEILLEIVSLLSRNDLSTCVRVNKAWHHAFMDNLWHTVELSDMDRHTHSQPAFDRVKSLYGPYLVARTKETVATAPSPFLRNIHRIRVMRVEYTSFFNLFWEHGALPLEAIPLEELNVDFEDDPKPLDECYLERSQQDDPWALTSVPTPAPTDIKAVLQILGRSTRLSTFTVITDTLYRKQQLQDQARLLASILASLETLKLSSNLPYQEEHADQEQQTKALSLFLELQKGGCFKKLTTLSIKGIVLDSTLLLAMLERSPKLEEMYVDGNHPSWSDSVLAKMVFNVKSKGWKTLGFRHCSEIGPFTVAVILQNSATLENLRLPGCLSSNSKSIQKLLCSAPNLKRFDLILEFVHDKHEASDEPTSLMAMDIVESAEDWICLELETFKCHIGGVPRDLSSKKIGSLLTDFYNSRARFSSVLESRMIQRRVLAKLGRLTKLREITLGKDVADYENRIYLDNCWDEEDMRTEFFNANEPQYQCLTMSLQDGLNELKDLKCLRRLTLEKMSLDMGDAEKTWMKENWPEYGKKSRDTFWTSRGHSFDINPTYQEQLGLYGYDWW